MGFGVSTYSRQSMSILIRKRLRQYIFSVYFGVFDWLERRRVRQSLARTCPAMPPLTAHEASVYPRTVGRASYRLCHHTNHCTCFFSVEV